MATPSKSERAASKSERAAALLAEQQRGEKRRQYAVVAGVVAVLLLIAGLTYYAMTQDDSGKAANDVPANTKDYGIVVGQADAPTTLYFYEDPLCPICGQFEAAVKDQVEAAVAAGKVQVHFRVVSFLDRQSTNDYSSRAANAAYAVADVAGPEVFLKFHDLLYSNQPAEGGPGPEDAQLIAWAVEAGADEAAITPLIEDKVFEQYIVNATDAMSKNDVSGTPTVFVNGKKIDGSPQESVDAVLKAVE